MRQTLARTLLFGALAYLAFGLLGGSPPGAPAYRSALRADSARGQQRVVYLARGLSAEGVIVLCAAVAADPSAVVLFDLAKKSSYTKAFLAAYKPDQVIPVGSFPDGVTELERRLDIKAEPILPWTRGPPVELWRSLFPRAEHVVVCPAEPRGQLLQAACLAGVVRAPLFVIGTGADETGELRRLLKEWKTEGVFLVGAAAKLERELEDVKVCKLADETAVAAAHRERLAEKVTPPNLVVANLADARERSLGMSTLAPWIALRKRAALLLTNAEGNNAEEVIRAALRDERLVKADSLLFVADLAAIPMAKRPNPIPSDKDGNIPMEPTTPAGTEPFTFATGRLFHEDPGVVALMIARQQLLASAKGPRKALVASNPGGSLPLLETFSRNTVKEFRNAGYDTTALFGTDINKDDLRKLLPEYDVFLWEGHHNTLINEYGFPAWDEPLPPSFVFLQSCLALTEEKAQPLLGRGAVAVVGATARAYSASGGACSLAFFDALLYEDQSLGGSLRQAKNFLLAYSLLKEKRLGKDAPRSGANLRAAWSFTLWGDPTLKLPKPDAPDGALPPIRHQVVGDSIVLRLPAATYDKVASAKYSVAMRPNARLAGLLYKENNEEDGKSLVPFAFAEVHLAAPRPGQTPRLRSKLPGSQWVFLWDGRRQSGYLLVAAGTKDSREIRFHVEWE